MDSLICELNDAPNAFYKRSTMENEYDVMQESIEILQFIAKNIERDFRKKEMSFKGGDKKHIGRTFRE
jgi:hypothetical protein